MHYVLCIIHPMSLHPMVVPMQKLRKMRIVHYEKVNCTVNDPTKLGRQRAHKAHDSQTDSAIPKVAGLHLINKGLCPWHKARVCMEQSWCGMSRIHKWCLSHIK